MSQFSSAGVQRRLLRLAAREEIERMCDLALRRSDGQLFHLKNSGNVQEAAECSSTTVSNIAFTK